MSVIYYCVDRVVHVHTPVSNDLTSFLRVYVLINRVFTINGLNTYSSYWTIDMITNMFTITLDNLSLDATYSATGYLDATPYSQGCIPSGNFTGGDTARITVAGLRVVGQATFFVNLVNDRVSIRRLSVASFSFTDITVDLGANFQIGWAPVDWPAFNGNLKACMDSEFAANNPAIVEKFRLAINEKIQHYTSEELSELIGNICPP